MPEDRQPCAGLSWKAASPQSCDPGTEGGTSPRAHFYLMSLALKCQELGTAGWLLGVAGGSKRMPCQFYLWSFENRGFRERRGLWWCIRGLSCSLFSLECCAEHPQTAVNPQYLWRVARSTATPASQGDTRAVPSVPEPPAAPVPHRKKSSLTLHACACFSGREPETSLLPPLPPLGLCSLPGRGKGARMSSLSGNTGLMSLAGQRTLFHFSV